MMMTSSNFIRYVYKNGEFTEHTEKDKYYNFKWEVDGTMAVVVSISYWLFILV